MITQVRKSLIAKNVCSFFPIGKKKKHASKESVLTKWQEKQLWPWAEERKCSLLLRRDKHELTTEQPSPGPRGTASLEGHRKVHQVLLNTHF